MTKGECPTCGRKGRWIVPEFGECTECRRTTNKLRGREEEPGRDDFSNGSMKFNPYETASNDPWNDPHLS